MSLPTEITDSYWVFHGTSNAKEKKDVGKWMLFYPKNMLDKKWKEMCILWDNNKLLGVLSMKCSTGKLNPRSSNDDEGIIILYCNNSGDEHEIMRIGKNIIPYIQDYPINRIFYKTDLQTRIGTKATGIKINYSYILNIEGASKYAFIDDD